MELEVDDRLENELMQHGLSQEDAIHLKVVDRVSDLEPDIDTYYVDGDKRKINNEEYGLPMDEILQIIDEKTLRTDKNIHKLLTLKTRYRTK